MMQAIAQALLMLSTSFELSILVKTTFILAVGLVATRVAQRARASTRHCLLAVTLGGVIVLPMALFVIPTIAIQMPMAGNYRSLTRDAALMGAVSSRTTASVLEPAEREVSVPEWPIKALARTGWCGGGMFLLLRLGIGLWRLGRLRRRGVPWLEQRTTIAALAAALGMRRRVDVLLLDQLTAPATSGSWHPAIMLPPDARGWSDAEVRRALVHELEHVRRGDWAIHLMARAACAAFWFNPLVWVAARQLSLEAERACDDAVLQEAGGIDYAAQLVRLARRLSGARTHQMLAMASRSDLSTRVSAILDSAQPRGRLRRGPAIAAVIVTAVFVLTLGPARAVGVAAPLVQRPFADAADVFEGQQPSGGASVARQGAQQPSSTQQGSLFVVGQVAMPGRYVFTPGVDVRRAMAGAGGFAGGLTETGVDISIKRQVGQETTSVPAVLTDRLRPGDTVVVQRKPSGNTLPDFKVSLVQGGAEGAAVWAWGTEPYQNGPWAGVQALPLKDGAVAPTVASFRVRAWKEGAQARVVVFAVASDASAPNGERETQIATFVLAEGASRDVAEALKYQAAPITVTAARVAPISK